MPHHDWRNQGIITSLRVLFARYAFPRSIKNLNVQAKQRDPVKESNAGGAIVKYLIDCLERKDRALVFGDFFQSWKERRIGNRGGLRAANQRFAFGPQGRDREGHGDAVIAEGVEFSSVKRLPARNL